MQLRARASTKNCIHLPRDNPETGYHDTVVFPLVPRSILALEVLLSNAGPQLFSHSWEIHVPNPDCCPWNIRVRVQITPLWRSLGCFGCSKWSLGCFSFSHKERSRVKKNLNAVPFPQEKGEQSQENQWRKRKGPEWSLKVNIVPLAFFAQESCQEFP